MAESWPGRAGDPYALRIVHASTPRRSVGRVLVFAVLIGAWLLLACNSRELLPPPGAPPVPPKPKPGDTPVPPRAEIVIAGRGDVPNLDPASQPTDAEADIIVSIYDRLVDLDQNLQPTPGLATSWKQVQPTVWEFSLRKGVAFSDGEPFLANTITTWFQRLEYIKDQHLGPSSIDLLPTLTGIKRVDQYAIQFVTSTPDPQLPMELAQPGASITPAGPFKDDDGMPVLQQQPNGTGPYQIGELSPGERVVLVPNHNYWGTPLKAKEVDVRVMPEATDRAAALEAGLVDIALDVPVSEVDHIKGLKGVEVAAVPAAQQVAWLGLNTSADGPLGDVRVRQAIATAIDTQGVVDANLQGLAIPVPSVASPALGTSCGIQPYPYNPTDARSQLAQAGAAGARIELAYASTATNQAPQASGVVQALVDALDQVGFQVQPRPMTSDALNAAIAAHSLTGAWYVEDRQPVLDAAAVLSRLPPSGNGTQDLISRLQTESDASRRGVLACQAQSLVHDAVPAVPLWQPTLRIAVDRRVVTWTPSGDGLLHVDRMTPIPLPVTGLPAH
jgi:peptide/nickel transport system substrate-binding protein